jgi:selenocysteine lyase/cysteine desulfurase
MIDFKFLREELIGNDFCFKTPYGERLMTYADYTASGRSIKFIEKYLIKLQKSYANTHTEDDVTGKSMTQILHKAEHLIKKRLNADKNCSIIANGTGATGAILKLQQILGLYIPPATKDRLNTLIEEYEDGDYTKKETIDDLREYILNRRPVVFIGPYEHHSNDIMWREGFGEVVEIELTKDGFIDLEDLEKKISQPLYEDRLKIGSFSASSNVTGTLTPVYDVARILHKHNAIACFDFAASAPYVDIDMNKDDESYLDAVFLSPHKFLGGPASSGILVFNEKLYRKDLPPTVAGGGTVDYVSSFGYDFSKDIEAREKPGTPGVMQIIKAALCIDLKNAVGIDKIEKQEHHYIEKVLDRLGKSPNIKVLGTDDPNKRIAIFSLLIKHKDKYLHPKLCTSLLNDLFGIQSRAGCSCAGPYGHRLLNIDKKTSEKFRKVINKGYSALKPGWLRVNFHYIMDEEEVEFILRAIEFIAEYGYLFIPEYKMNLYDGIWSHKSETGDNSHSVNFGIEHILNTELNDCFTEKDINRKQEYKLYLDEAKKIAEELKKSYSEDKFSTLPDKDTEELRVFYFSERS